MINESSEQLTLKYPDLGGISLEEIRQSCHPVLRHALEQAIESVGGPAEAVAGFSAAI